MQRTLSSKKCNRHEHKFCHRVIAWSVEDGVKVWTGDAARQLRDARCSRSVRYFHEIAWIAISPSRHLQAAPPCTPSNNLLPSRPPTPPFPCLSSSLPHLLAQSPIHPDLRPIRRLPRQHRDGSHPPCPPLPFVPPSRYRDSSMLWQLRPSPPCTVPARLTHPPMLAFARA